MLTHINTPSQNLVQMCQLLLPAALLECVNRVKRVEILPTTLVLHVGLASLKLTPAGITGHPISATSKLLSDTKQLPSSVAVFNYRPPLICAVNLHLQYKGNTVH